VEREDTIKADITSHGSSDSDVYTKLMKLKQLKDDGLLTEEEFQRAKTDLLKKD